MYLFNGCCSFREGNYGTKFIPLEYPQGFKGESLTDLETNELIAAGVALHGQRCLCNR